MEQTITGHTAHRDDEASKIGMWLFLFTEMLLFGGLFLVYTIYRNLNSEAFSTASQELSVAFGYINTVVLLTSSLTVALSISAIRSNNPKKAKMLLWITLIFALIFMINKYFEWSAKINHGLFPGMEHFMSLPPGEGLFFLLYFFMTGLHGLHIIAGSIFIWIVIRQIKKGKIKHDDYILQENAGLYWHLVDIIWIYLFPLFYLIH